MPMSKDSTTLGFLIFPGFPMSCLTSAIEPLRAANEISGQAAFDWKLFSEAGERVQSSAQIWFDPDHALNAAADLDYLFLLSGPQAAFNTPRGSNGKLRSLSRHGVRIGGVSGGVFPLARSGLLAGYTCSVHWCYASAFAGEFPDLTTESDVIIIDRDRLTVSGAAAVFDLMLTLIDTQLGEEVTTEVACWFQHPLMRGQGVRQKVPTLHRESTSDMLPPSVAQAIRIFADHFEDLVNVDDVAQMVGLSPRQLERNFKSATGQSPSRYYRSMRMTAARQLVLYSNDSMTRIAAAVGYGATAPLVRHYRDAFGVTPQQDRQKINLFRVEKNRPLPS